MKNSFTALFMALLLSLSACSQTGSAIGSHLTLCCPGDYSTYTEYALSTENMPLFLRDYVVSEFDQAMQEKGLGRNDQINDLRIVLRYNHVNLDSQTQDVNPFVRMESLNVELSYIAEMEVEMIETRSNKIVWAGTISRIHRVSPGEYMHEDRASPAFLQAFRNLLADYPTI